MEHTERKLSSYIEPTERQKSGSLGAHTQKYLSELIDNQGLDLKTPKDENSELTIRVRQVESVLQTAHARNSHHRVQSSQISSPPQFEFTPAKLVEKQPSHRPSKSQGQSEHLTARPPVRIWRQKQESKPVKKEFHKVWRPKSSIRWHMDAVRDLYFSDSLLFSASEDCTLKIWDTHKIKSDGAKALATLRGHLGPVLTVTGHEDSIFSGGVDGGIFAWDKLGNRIKDWEAHSDAIWRLRHNPCLLYTSPSPRDS